MKAHLAVSLLLLIMAASLALGQAVPQRVRVSDTVMSAQVLTKVAPTYPPLARQARIQGTVVLKVQISKSGDVEDVQLSSGHPMLAPAAIEAVKQWKYKPFLLNGEPVAVETSVTVNFTLADNPPAENDAGDGNSAPSRVRVSRNVMQSLLVKKVQPGYPPEAKEEHIQGVVLLQVILDKEGSVANIQLISGHPSLAPAAIEAVKQWKYRPYLLNGAPIDVETQVAVNFTLSE